MSVMDSMLGKKGEPVMCNQFMHWWEAGAKIGAACLCGEKKKKITTITEVSDE